MQCTRDVPLRKNTTTDGFLLPTNKFFDSEEICYLLRQYKTNTSGYTAQRPCKHYSRAMKESDEEKYYMTGQTMLVTI
jgi:hypothetical protein